MAVRQGIGDGIVLRFLTVAALGVLTSGCMIGVVMSPLIPVRGEAAANQAGITPQQPAANTAGQQVQQPAAPMPTRTDDGPTPTAPLNVRQRLLGTWLAEDTSQGLDRVSFMNYPPNTPDASPAGGRVEAGFNGQRILGDFLLSGPQIAMKFPGEEPVVYDFEFMNDGRLRIGRAIYRKG
jgi:hypothetical protein